MIVEGPWLIDDLPEGVLAVRVGPGANCSSAGSAIDVLFYGSVFVGALAVALAAALPPRPPVDDDADPLPGPELDPSRDTARTDATLSDRDPPHR
jgi:hypothetical protein